MDYLDQILQLPIAVMGGIGLVAQALVFRSGIMFSPELSIAILTLKRSNSN